MKYNVTNIKWCVDNPDDLETLPTSTEVYCKSEDEIADALSDEFGFLVENFSVD